MIINRLQREESDKIFTIVRNISGGTIAVGSALEWSTSSPDGVRVSQPTTNALSLFMGILVEALTDSQYGKAQVHNFCASALVTNNTSVAIVAGEILVPVNAAYHLARSAASDGKTGFVFAGEAVATATTPAAALKKVFLKNL